MAPEVYAIFAETRVLSFYTGIAVGISYQNEIVTYSDKYYNRHYSNGKNRLGDEMEFDNGRRHANFQATLVGMSAGFRHFRAFAELGYGYKGMVCIGLCSQFSKIVKRS